MKDVERRIKRIEDTLGGPNKPPSVLELVWFGDKSDMPLEKKEGNRIIRHIHINDITPSKDAIENERQRQENLKAIQASYDRIQQKPTN